MSERENSGLKNAKASKNDEFYTQLHDIQRELNAYIDYDANVFRDKTILLPCDDPEWSNFTRLFAQRFNAWGLKKLISTGYSKTNTRGKIYTLDICTGDIWMATEIFARRR